MTTPTICAACPQPTTTGVLCTDCTHALDDTLSQLPWLLQQLHHAATRQTRLATAGPGSRQHETPLPFNPRASTELDTATAELRLWQARIADHLGQPVRHPHPVLAVRWITDHTPQLHTWTDAGHLLDVLERLVDRITDVINRPQPAQYLGDCTSAAAQHIHDGTTCDCACHNSASQPCDVEGGCGLDQPAGVDPVGCPGRVYADPRQAEGRCDTCGQTYDATSLRLKLLADLDDQLLTAAEIARTASYMGLSVTREQVRKRVNVLANRGRISAVTSTSSDGPRFRFGTVRLLLEEDEERRQQRAG